MTLGELYRHLDPALTRAQAQNLTTVGRHLVESSRQPGWDPAYFKMGTTAYDLETDEVISPQQVAAFPRKLLNDPLGHAPLAGIDALSREDWRAYQERVFGAAFDSPLESWLFSGFWASTDNTPVGAALRMVYVLEYGVPYDFHAVSLGDKPSDYTDNCFLWERLDLQP